MDTHDFFSSSPLQMFSSSGQVATTAPPTRTSSYATNAAPSSSTTRRLATTTRAESAPSLLSTASSSSRVASGSHSRGSRLLDALDSLSASQPQLDDSPPSKRRRKAVDPEQAAVAQAKKAEEKAAKTAEKVRQKSAKAAQMATKKDWTDANKLRRSKSETIREMVVDIDAALTAPAFTTPSGSNATVSTSDDHPERHFAGALHGAGIKALEARLLEEGASLNILGQSTTGRAPSSTRPLSHALGISTPLPDFPSIRLRRKIKARLDVEHRIWVPLAAPTMQHEPSAIFVLSAPEVLEHLSRGEGSLAQMIPRARANLASSGGVAHSAAFQLFFVVIGLQVHFHKVQQKNDQDYRKEVQQRLARRDLDDGAAEEGTALTSSRRKKQTVQEMYAHVDQEAAELELLRLTMEHGVYVIHSKSLIDAVESIVDIVGEVGIRPYKMIANSHLPFCTDSIKIRTAAGEANTYNAMLQQIPRVTEPAARAVQAHYPTLRSLMEAYDCAREADLRARTTSRVDDLLAECEILNRVDGKATSRKAGKAMSKRIGFVMTQEDPLALL
ncbi:hypothetical protein V8E36_002298 [Tilletia maclaganii]